MCKSLIKYGCFVAFFMMTTISCDKENSVGFIDTELALYFERFAEEGSLRGIEVNYESYEVEGFIQSIGEGNVVGQCSHTEESPNAVIIDPLLWQRASESKREQVIFHELGHCYLQRGHDDSKDGNGVCMSIMHSSTDICSLNYAQNRDYYLDELFKN
tara:strand:+ start:1547 stop:2020 length:474 start_codon:yes stop_codon:yes gene_type:complete